jgi:hypothetical protein
MRRRDERPVEAMVAVVDAVNKSSRGEEEKMLAVVDDSASSHHHQPGRASLGHETPTIDGRAQSAGA